MSSMHCARSQKRYIVNTLSCESSSYHEIGYSMRSFIKSHRNSNSLDGNQARINAINASNMAAQEQPEGLYQRRSQDIGKATNVQSTLQSGPSYANVNGPRHAPSLESLQRLATKSKFASKLFKKNSSSISGNIGSHTDPSTPRNRDSDTFVDALSQSSESTDSPAIKGTITHHWGENSDNHHSVIILNEPNSRNSLASESSSDIERVTSYPSGRRGSTVSSNHGDPYSFPKAEAAFSKHQDYNYRKYIIESEIIASKSKNRQARIHSNDDILQLGNTSSMDIDIFKSTLDISASPRKDEADSTSLHTDSAQEDSIGMVGKNVKVVDFSPSSPIAPNSELYVSKQRNLWKSFTASIDAERNASDNTLSEDNEDDDDEGDDNSKFSFEYNNMNGRTSSVKYYSKVEPSYIDDMYEDENFDENMNYISNSYEESEFPSSRFDYDAELNESISDNQEGPLALDSSNKITKYQDLFNLSDDSGDDQKSVTPVKTSNDIDCLAENKEERKISHETLSVVAALPKAGSPLDFVDQNLRPERNTENITIGQLLANKNSDKDKAVADGHTLVPPLLDSFSYSDHNSALSVPSSSLLPPPSNRQKILKYYDLNSSLDSDVPGLTSNLFFIDETEEDRYNKLYRIADEEYLDEINKVPEEYNFSDSDHEGSPYKSPTRNNSYRRTHSFSGKPAGVVKESTPQKHTFEYKNKKVTVFSNNEGTVSRIRSPRKHDRILHTPDRGMDEQLESETINSGMYRSTTPEKMLAPVFNLGQDISLSPIQETSSSVDSSPRR